MRTPWTLVALLLASDLAAQPTPGVWNLTEELRIGSVDGPQAMTSVADITTSPDGRYLYLMESAERALWMFDARSGAFLRKIGRGGDGPGEFRGPLKVGWRGDTLYVTDWQLPRITLFTADGELLRTISFQPPVVPQTGLGIASIGYTADGEVLAAPLLASHHVRGGTLDEITWFLLSSQGEILRTVGRKVLRGGGATISLGGGIRAGRSLEMSLPMTDRNFIGIESDGESLVLLNQPAGPDPAGRFQLVRVTPGGDTIYTRTYNYRPHAVSRATRDSIREVQVERYASAFELQPARVRSVVQEHLTFPEYHPPFTVLRGWLTVTGDGSAWLRREDLGGSTVNWLVVGADGGITGTVIAPRALLILHVADGKVWGTIADEYDIPYVVRYGLSAQRPG